jgi:hypothetical protein
MAFFFEQGRNRRVAEGLRSLQEVNKVLREVEPYLNPVAREDFVTRLHVCVYSTVLCVPGSFRRQYCMVGVYTEREERALASMRLRLHRQPYAAQILCECPFA